MDRLLAQADTDLRRALELDPRLTPVYNAMIHAGGLSLGEKYALGAAKRGLAIAPDNFSIHAMLMWLEQPKWSGSLAAMDRLAAQAQAHAGTNPLLRMLSVRRPLYEIDNCSCTKAQELAAYPAAFDQLGTSSQLLVAGNAAHGVSHAVSAIYLSEALRFDPTPNDARIRRVYDLVDLDEAQWGVAEASRMIATLPHDADPLKARAFAHAMLGDSARAEQDYRAAIRIAPADRQSLAWLGNLYVYQSHDWDKGWVVADQLIKSQPDDPYGWMLRASIQLNEPRAGLRDTVEYFESHFGSRNPQLREVAVKMRSAMVLQDHSGAKVLADKSGQAKTAH